ncbi:unnamed protein product [Pleuronectes platessa]|uniref:Uncharacterized protein n=1 Tax=Pleuronectes platessa TaxID=8262 RepID=A0A9N7Z415_PLEPL|nr:unnamed protein product [Pleuronectes platessa]
MKPSNQGPALRQFDQSALSSGPTLMTRHKRARKRRDVKDPLQSLNVCTHTQKPRSSCCSTLVCSLSSSLSLSWLLSENHNGA